MKTHAFVPALVWALISIIAASASATTHQVSVANFAFTPSALTVADGDTVRWVRVNGTHTVTSGEPCTADGLFNGSLNSTTTEFVHVFDDGAGVYPYFCIPHCSMGMTGTITVTAPPGFIEEPEAALHDEGALHVWPNPFAPVANLSFRIAEPALVQVMILDPAGRRVASLADARFDPGEHRLRWDGIADDGRPAGSGVYYARMRSERSAGTVPLMLVR